MKSFILAVLMVVTLSANATPVTYIEPTENAEVISGIISGTYYLDVNGESIAAYCNDFNTHISKGQTWDGIIYSLSDINNIANTKFTGVERYNQVAYLLNMDSTFSEGELNLVIWEIFTPGSISYMTADVYALYSYIISGAFDSYITNNFFVITPNPYNASQEFIYTTEVSEPAGLFALGLLGMVGLRRFKK